MDSIRTFIALDLPEALLERLAQLQRDLRNKADGVRWVRPERIHLTLKFIGSTSEQQAEGVCSALSRLSAGASAFPVQCCGIGAFPNDRNPKVIWAGLRPDASLAVFQEAIERELELLGIAREKRPFSPHLTLGRVKDTRKRKQISGVLERYANGDLGSHVFSRVVYYKSDLQPAGPVYTALHTADLSPLK